MTPGSVILSHHCPSMLGADIAPALRAKQSEAKPSIAEVGSALDCGTRLLTPLGAENDGSHDACLED